MSETDWSVGVKTGEHICRKDYDVGYRAGQESRDAEITRLGSEVDELERALWLAAMEHFGLERAQMDGRAKADVEFYVATVRKKSRKELEES